MTTNSTSGSGARASDELLSSLRKHDEVAQVEESVGKPLQVKLRSGSSVLLSRVAASARDTSAWEARLHLADPPSEPDAVTRSKDLSVESAASIVRALIRLDSARLIASQVRGAINRNEGIGQSPA